MARQSLEVRAPEDQEETALVASLRAQMPLAAAPQLPLVAA